MSVSTTNVFDQYTASGGVSFSITFYVRSATWLTVLVDGVSTGAFNTVLNINQSATPGGDIVFIDAPDAGAVIRIERHTPILQPDVYNPYGPFPAQTVEYDFDRAICIMQELAYAISQLSFPTPYIAGWFLTNDGTNLLWAPVSGGGGGGITVIGATTTPTPNAAIISGSENNVLQLAVGDEDNAGLVSITTQSASGLKKYLDGAATSTYDIRLYGANPLPTSTSPVAATYDATDAIYDAVAAWQQSNVFQGRDLIGGVYIPSGVGDFLISRPLVHPSGTQMYGDGKFLSVLRCGTGDSATPTLVQGFAGPTIYPRGELDRPQADINFVPSILTGSGTALEFVDNTDPASLASIIWLGDAWCWSKFMNQSVTNPNPTAISMQIGAIQFAGASGRGQQLWGTCGRPISGVSGQDIGIGLWIVPDDATLGYKFSAYLTTTGEGQQHIEALADAVNGNTYNLELSWDGAHFRFYINGVHQGSHTATGTMVKAGWEWAGIGATGPEYFRANSPTAGNVIDSLRFSNVARHTGTGSFTPPTAKYAWDADTLWLWNGDLQAACPANQLFLMAQTRLGIGGNAPGAGWVYHYCRPETQPFALDSARYSWYRDFALFCNDNSGGITTRDSDHLNFSRLFIDRAAMYAYAVWDDDSFYTFAEQCDVSGCIGESFVSTGTLRECKTIGSVVGYTALAGTFVRCDDQPGGDSLAPWIYGGKNASFGSVFAQGNTIDEEGNFPYQRYSALIDCGGYNSAVFMGQVYQSKNSGDGHAAVVYSSIPFSGVMHIGDAFFTDPYVPTTKALARTTLFPGIVTLLNCSLPYNTSVSPANQIEGEGWVQWMGQDGEGTSIGGFTTNTAGISATDTPSLNLNGNTFVLAAYTSGRVNFNVPQLNTKYSVNLTPSVFFGSAPTAGSNRVVSVTKHTYGFEFEVEVAPGGDCIQYFDWVVTGSYDFPDSYTYLPANPSVIDNAEAGSEDFAVGVTLVPTTTNSIFTYWGSATQTITESGTVPLSDNWWELYMSHGAYLGGQVGQLAGYPGTGFFVAADGNLRSMFSPGPHNVAISGNELGTSNLYIDGGLLNIATAPGIAGYTAVNDADVYLGERWDASRPFADGTFRNWKVDSRPTQTITYEPDAGPQVGQIINVIIGDDFSLGNTFLADTGSYASQIAADRLPGVYYHMMCDLGKAGALTTQPDPLHPSSIVPGIFARGFSNWAALQTFDTVVVQVGFQDILYYDVSAADIWDVMLPMLEGAYASGIWEPSDRYDNAFGDLVPPVSGSAQVTIQGITHTCTFNTTAKQTNIDFAAIINADPALNTIIYAEEFQMPPATQAPLAIWNNTYFSPGTGGTGGDSFCIIVTLPPLAGPAGNGTVTTTTDGANGCNWGGWVVTKGSRAASEMGIAGETFPAGLDTDADTTVNNLIALMAANPTVNALVTGTLVAHQLKVTANTIGNDGNDIGVYGTNAWIPPSGISGWLDLGTEYFKNLRGGFNGILQTGATTIVVATVPPFGDDPSYSAGKETERNALNTLIRNWCTAHAGDGAVCADFDVALRNAGDHTKIDPAYLAGTQYINDAGQTVLFTLVDGLVP